MPPSPRRLSTTPRTPVQPSPDKVSLTDTTQDGDISWNTATAKLPAFIAALDKNDAMLSSTPGLLSLWTRGYDIDSKGRKIVESDKHMLFCIQQPDKEYTFEEPSPVGAYTIASGTEARAIAVRLGIAPDPSTPTDRLAAAQEQATSRQKELKELFLVNAARLKEIDRTASTFITSRITNETYARNLANTHHHSGRAVLRSLITLKTDKVSDKAKMRIKTEFDDREKEGIHNPTVEGFNELVNDLTRLNTQLKKPKDESDLAEIYITATRDSLGEIRSCKFDVKRDALQDKRETNSWSDKKWLDAVSELITDQITDMEDDSDRAASTARALAARQKRDPNKNRRGDANPNPSTPGADARGPRPAWTVPKGKCKHCGKCGAPGTADAGHWNSDCSLLVKNGGTIDPSKKSTPEDAPPPTTGSSKMSRAEAQSATGRALAAAAEQAAVSAFFAGGSQELDLTQVSSPTELLAALENSTTSTGAAGRSLMARLATVPDDDGDDDDVNSEASSEESDGDELVEDDDEPEPEPEPPSPVYSPTSSEEGEAEDEFAAEPVPMGTPVSPALAALGDHVVALHELSPVSPVKDFRAHVLRSPIAAVRAVKLHTGGAAKRTRHHILTDIYRATALSGSAQQPTEGDDAAAPAAAAASTAASRARAAAEAAAAAARAAADAATAEMAAATAAAEEKAAAAAAAALAETTAHLDLLSKPPSVPPIVQDPQWSVRVQLRAELAMLYRHSWLEDGKSEPPNMSPLAKKLHAKRNAFCHRDFDVEFGHDGFGGGTARGYRGKTALYMREFLVGTGVFAQARTIHPPQGTRYLLDTLARVQQHVATILLALIFEEHSEDAAIWAIAGHLEADFAAAYAEAAASPLRFVHVPVYSLVAGPVPLSAARAGLVTTLSGCVCTTASSLLAILVGILAVASLVGSDGAPRDTTHLLTGTSDLIDHGAASPTLRHICGTCTLALLSTDPHVIRRAFSRPQASTAGGATAVGDIPTSAHRTTTRYYSLVALIAVASALSALFSLASQLTLIAATAVVSTYSAAVGDWASCIASARCATLTRIIRRPLRLLAHGLLYGVAMTVSAHIAVSATTAAERDAAPAAARATGAAFVAVARLGGGDVNEYLNQSMQPTTTAPRCRAAHVRRRTARGARVRRSNHLQPCSSVRAPPIVGRACLAPCRHTEGDADNTIYSKHQVGKYTQNGARALKNSLFGVMMALVMDSGCTFHCHPHKSDLLNVRPLRERMMGIDGHACDITGIGDLPIVAKDRNGKYQKLLIKDVRCAPQFTDTLLSVEQFWRESRVEVRFANHRSITIPATAEAPREKFLFEHTQGLYQWRVMSALRAGNHVQSDAGRSLASVPLPVPEEHCVDHDRPLEHASKIEQVHGAKSTSHIAAQSADAAVDALHRRLHIGQDLIRKLPQITADAPANLQHGRTHSCAACLEANATRLPHKGTRYQPSRVGRLVHADIVGPFKRSLVGSYQYMLVLVDDHSRFISVHFLARKSDAPQEIRAYVANLNAMVNSTKAVATQIVGTLHTDNAGEFLSHEFGAFLDEQLITQTTCPPHVHSLNGVAERAIRAVVENMRSTMVAGNVPVIFWNYLAIHSADVLNRTGGPPDSPVTAHELVMGEKPKVMSIWPIGCRAFPVKPRSAYSKTNIEPHAWSGINLGRVPSIPSAYYVWLSRLHRVAITSDVWFEETLMPWRPKGDQRVGVPPPHHALPDDQPPGLPTAPTVPSTQAPAATTLSSAFDHAVLSPAANARRSSLVLLLFSGPKRRPDGLAAFLNQLGYSCELVDNDPVDGGGAREDLLDDSVYETLLERVKNGEFLAIIAAPPCSTFSISRFIKPKGGKEGPAPLRTRSEISGIAHLTEHGQRVVGDANTLVRRTCALLAAGAVVGTQFLVENPSDRGDPRETDIYLHEDHGPLWLMPAMLALERVTSARRVTFPMCAFQSPWQKFTTLLHSPGFEPWIAPLESLRCHHKRHESMAGGELDDNGWNSARAAAYPANFNYYLARSVASLTDAALPPEQAVPAGGRGATRPKDGADQPSEAPTTPATDRTPPSPSPHTRAEAHSSPARVLDFGDAASPAPVPPPAHPGQGTSRPDTQPPAAQPPAAREPRIQKTYTRTRQSKPELAKASTGVNAINMALLCMGGPWRLGVPTHDSPAFAMLANANGDPRNHSEAMKRDPIGWLKAEKDELENHRENASWEYIDRTTFDKTGRKLVKTTWVYKTKRSGKLKARLCVQGCSQIPGVDYDQTHCSTMRGPTMRLLSSLAARLNLRMRRWDFVSAYLQGELLEGEVVYCLPPPGHASVGADGRDQVLKVVKPIYGMAQAGRRWQRSLYPWMEEWQADCAKFTRLFSDTNVFMCKHEVDTPTGKRSEVLIVGVYVDDQFVLYSHDDEHSLYSKYTTALKARWQVEDEGEVSDLLGVDISAADGHVELTQASYIVRLADTWFPEGVPATIQSNQPPADKNLPQLVADALVNVEPRAPEQVKAFQSLVGALLYAAINTRPDVAYAVGMLCRAMAKPTPELHAAALHVLGYLYRTREIGLRYQADSKPLYGMTDSDWAVKHSTSGFVFMYNSAAITWGSKKQSSVALSSCEAELMAASLAATEAVHLKAFLEELKEAGDAPVSLACDNTAARDTAYNPEHHQKVKHIERRHFYVRECIENHQITVPYVNTIHNLADFFTKPLEAKDFFRMRDVIMNVPKHSAFVSRMRRVASLLCRGVDSIDGGVLADASICYAHSACSYLG